MEQKSMRILKLLKKIKRTSHKKACQILQDKKWSSAVKKIAGDRCEKCGSKSGLQSHHVFTRSNQTIRHYIPNGVCLCSGHHFFFAHKKPHEFRDWITALRGQAWWDDLNAKSNIRKQKFF